MDAPEQRELEKFIDQQLKKLPPQEAPANLVANVLAAITVRENLPWWKQPFTSWPRNTQALLFTTLSLAFVALVYFTWRPAESISAANLAEKASSYGWLPRTIEAGANGLLLVLRSVPWQWFVAASVVCLSMYAACVATGFALYRVTARHIGRDGLV